jgi:choline dehydrogenase-like flavoprotein
MFHNSKPVAALAKEPNDTVYQKTLGINDFYLATQDRPPLGNIQMLGKSNAGAMKGEEPKLTKLVPSRALAEVARHSVDFWLTTEDLPRPDNRVTLDGDGNVHLAYTFTNEQPTAGLYRELETILNKTGLSAHDLFRRNFYLDMDVPIAGVAHQAGTCRFGPDQASSVADLNCKAHELDNLYFADASVFPSVGAVNPGLTVMANAMRVADHLTERLG